MDAKASSEDDRKALRAAVEVWDDLCLREYGNSGGVLELGFVEGWRAAVAHYKRQIEVGDTRIQEFIPDPSIERPILINTWGDTNTCCVFFCTCGKAYHIDEGLGDFLRCAACGRLYDIERRVKVTELPEGSPHYDERMKLALVLEHNFGEKPR